jgi:hypothetical protein
MADVFTVVTPDDQHFVPGLTSPAQRRRQEYLAPPWSEPCCFYWCDQQTGLGLLDHVTAIGVRVTLGYRVPARLLALRAMATMSEGTWV